jgi:hypothetical protein
MSHFPSSIAPSVTRPVLIVLPSATAVKPRDLRSSVSVTFKEIAPINGLPSPFNILKCRYFFHCLTFRNPVFERDIIKEKVMAVTQRLDCTSAEIGTD